MLFLAETALSGLAHGVAAHYDRGYRRQYQQFRADQRYASAADTTRLWGGEMVPTRGGRLKQQLLLRPQRHRECTPLTLGLSASSPVATQRNAGLDGVAFQVSA
jgi:hypothetical protein